MSRPGSSRVNPGSIGCGCTGAFDLNMRRVDGEIFVSGRKMLRIQNIRMRVTGGLILRCLELFMFTIGRRQARELLIGWETGASFFFNQSLYIAAPKAICGTHDKLATNDNFYGRRPPWRKTVNRNLIFRKLCWLCILESKWNVPNTISVNINAVSFTPVGNLIGHCVIFYNEGVNPWAMTWKHFMWS